MCFVLNCYVFAQLISSLLLSPLLKRDSCNEVSVVFLIYIKYRWNHRCKLMITFGTFWGFRCELTFWNVILWRFVSSLWNMTKELMDKWINELDTLVAQLSSNGKRKKNRSDLLTTSFFFLIFCTIMDVVQSNDVKHNESVCYSVVIVGKACNLGGS